jgi:hypothetical protein
MEEMMKNIAFRAALALAAACTISSAAQAITLDGVLDLDGSYGPFKAIALDSPTPPNGNFQTPGPFADSNQAFYSKAEPGMVYFFIASDDMTLPFSNIYLDLDPHNDNGSDLGFEVTNDRAFVPGVAGYAEALDGLNFVVGTSGFEFSISNALLTSPIAGLSNHPLASIGGDVVLRLSQTGGYAVVGGETYGPNRLGRVTLIDAATAVPEPASWAMLIGGFGLVGGTMRRSRQAKTLTYA